ncbi:MAG: glycosyltransferase family 2 protein, partial [Xanthomonadales bacterium]|nr:glycosyltransferase family 2 protein [Xanthomonadales bacterium]
MELSIILPALNEARSLETLLPELIKAFPDAEIIVIDDGSRDDTPAVCERLSVRVVSNPYRMGNGAAIKRGARAAKGKNLAMIDSDGQHTAAHLQRLWQRFKGA